MGFSLGAKGIAIAAAIFAIVVLWQRGTIADLRTEIATLTGDLAMARANVATAVAVNDRNVIELEKVRKAAAAARTAFAREKVNARERCEIDTRMREEIRRAEMENPATCPVADSLRSVVDGLRDSVAGSADRDADRDGDDPPAR